jgi:hypothetical protein
MSFQARSPKDFKQPNAMILTHCLWDLTVFKSVQLTYELNPIRAAWEKVVCAEPSLRDSGKKRSLRAGLSVFLCASKKPLDQAAQGLIIFPLRGNNFLGLFWLYLSAVDSISSCSHNTLPVP